MISQYDDLTGKDADVQNFLKMIKEKNSEEVNSNITTNNE